jgi:hypothetical protein
MGNDTRTPTKTAGLFKRRGNADRNRPARQAPKLRHRPGHPSPKAPPQAPPAKPAGGKRAGRSKWTSTLAHRRQPGTKSHKAHKSRQSQAKPDKPGRPAGQAQQATTSPSGPRRAPRAKQHKTQATTPTADDHSRDPTTREGPSPPASRAAHVPKFAGGGQGTLATVDQRVTNRIVSWAGYPRNLPERESQADSVRRVQAHGRRRGGVPPAKYRKTSPQSQGRPSSAVESSNHTARTP